MNSPDGRECSEFPQDKKTALGGVRTSTLYLLNPQERTVDKIQVDDCAITEGLRCDWLVLLNDLISTEEIFVELKGSDISHAIEQLKTSVEKLSADRKRFPKRCLVVFSRNPRFQTDIQNSKKRFKKDFNAAFSLVRNRSEVSL
jgi:hypothetical protein